MQYAFVLSFVYVSSVKCAFRIHFSLARRHNVTDNTHTKNTNTHLIEDTVYTVRIMRNIQYFIIKEFVESSTYPVPAQQCPWAIYTKGT